MSKHGSSRELGSLLKTRNKLDNDRKNSSCYLGGNKALFEMTNDEYRRRQDQALSNCHVKKKSSSEFEFLSEPFLANIHREHDGLYELRRESTYYLFMLFGMPSEEHWYELDIVKEISFRLLYPEGLRV